MKRLTWISFFAFFSLCTFSQNNTLIINKTATQPVIDGLASESVWLAQPKNNVEKAIGNTATFSGYFKMCYDDNNLYILVSVRDTTPNNVGAASWQSDCVELFFAMDVSNSASYRPGDCSIRKIASKTQANGGVEVSNNTLLNSNSNFKVVQVNGTSYVQEWQIPINALKSSSNYNGNAFRFDIQLSDNDGSGNNRTGQLFWNSNADDQWNSVLNQGTVELSGNLSGVTGLINSGSVWKYFKGTTNPSSGWNQDGFDDSSWNSGASPFRYGDGAGGTELVGMQNSYLTVFLRKTFQITDPDSMLQAMIFSLSYDDGFRMYVNGKAILEKNAGVNDDANTPASGTVSDYGIENIQLSAEDANIRSGENTIAIVLSNVNLGSSDLYFDLTTSLIKKEPPMPKAPEVVFDHAGGYYNNPFDLILSSVNVGDTILYTTDCSEPSTSLSTQSGVSPLKININPANMFGRPNTPGVVIRAVVKKTGYSSRTSETRTYIFPERVRTQKYPGSPWPSSNVNGQEIQLNTDSAMAFSANYKDLVITALKSIPTVSLVTENDNLFNSLSGIYVNALNHGEAWERPASVELIETDNSEQFATNVGVRVRGGYSRNGFNPKHAFRIFYRGEYGKKKLKYPIFGANGADEFDKIDLRCAQNYSWSLAWNERLTYAQDEFCRDVQGLMGRPHTRSRYCHLFLNGLYWGLYEFQERAEANFAATYMGGDKDNYDVIKVATDNGYNLEATDGDMNMYRNVYNLTNNGFTNMTNFYRLQGLNSSGNIDTSLNALVDVDNLIDYMMNIFYSGNFDSPQTIWANNNGPNNYYAIKNRKHKRQGFFFVVHDAEHTLNYVPGSEHGSQEGVNEDRVNLDKKGMSSPSFEKFTAQWLHHRLTFNPEYKMKFADRVYKEFYNNGLFTPTVAAANFKNRTNQIDKAIIGESIRWGHGYLNRNDHWVPAVNKTITEFINKRTSIVIEQLQSAELLPYLDAVNVSVNDKLLQNNKVDLVGSVTVKLQNPGTTGTIYYTLDGSDPRLVGGAINSKAFSIGSGSTFNVSFPLKLKSRILYGTEWSPLREVLFTNKENREGLRITEIQYNPKALNAANSKDMEFIEIKNIGDKGVDLGGCRLDSAAKFVFPVGTIINPNGFVVIASDKNDFEYVYRVAPTGVFTGNLSNEGERIMLFDENNQALLDVKYGVTNPWPITVNGTGYSLVSIYSKPDKNENDSEYWKRSLKLYGSPFSDDSTYVEPNIIDDLKFFCNVYPNPVSEELYINVSENKPINVQINDLSGRAVWQSKSNNYSGSATVNFRKLALKPGVYLVDIKSGNKQWQKKIVYQE